MGEPGARRDETSARREDAVIKDGDCNMTAPASGSQALRAEQARGALADWAQVPRSPATRLTEDRHKRPAPYLGMKPVSPVLPPLRRPDGHVKLAG